MLFQGRKVTPRARMATAPPASRSVNNVPADPEISTMSRRTARWRLAAIVVGTLCAALLLWRVTPLARFADTGEVARWMEVLRQTWWSPLAVIGLFVLGGLAVFPVTLMIAATALVFDAPLAIALSFVGVLANAAVTYAVGAWWVRATLLAAFGRRLAKLGDALAKRGVIAVAVIRMVPIAPFSIVNLAAGSMSVRFRDYMIGTALGVAPGVVALSVFGHQLREVFRNPTFAKVALLVALVAAWVGLSFVLQYYLSRRNDLIR